MQKKGNLKLCPFCGGKVRFSVNGNWVAVTCFRLKCKCNPSTPWLKTKEQAAEAWNTRATLDINQNIRL